MNKKVIGGGGFNQIFYLGKWDSSWLMESSHNGRPRILCLLLCLSTPITEIKHYGLGNLSLVDLIPQAKLDVFYVQNGVRRLMFTILSETTFH